MLRPERVPPHGKAGAAANAETARRETRSRIDTQDSRVYSRIDLPGLAGEGRCCLAAALASCPALRPDATGPTTAKDVNTMHKRLKLFAAALTAMLALAVVSTTANASRSFDLRNNTLLTYTSRDLQFREPGGRLIECDVTLTASLHTRFAKFRGTLIGFVTGGISNVCANEFETETDLRFLVEHANPWHLTLNSFRGTLPRITELLFTFLNVRFLFSAIEPLGGRLGCLYQGDVGAETSGRTGATEFTLERMRLQAGGNLVALVEERLDGAPFLSCPTRGILAGSYTATLPPLIRLT